MKKAKVAEALKNVSSKMKDESNPKNKELYNNIVQQAKQKFKWPSAYASIWVSREYKKRSKRP